MEIIFNQIETNNIKQKVTTNCNFWQITWHSAYKSSLYEVNVLYNLKRNLADHKHFFVYAFTSSFIKESYNKCITNKGYSSIIVSACSNGLKEWLKGNIFSLGVTSSLIYEYGKNFFLDKNHNLEFNIGVEAIIRVANGYFLGRNIYTALFEGINKGATIYYVKTEIEPATDFTIKTLGEELNSILGLNHDNHTLTDML